MDEILYRNLRRHEANMVILLGSLKSATAFSIAFGMLQSLLIGAGIYTFSVWHFTRISSSIDACGSLSFSHLSISTLFCLSFYLFPGAIILCPLFGFLVWPLCIVFSGFALLWEKNVKRWPFLPALHLEIAHLQSILLIGYFRWTYHLEKTQFIQSIHQHFPPEILNSILDISDRDAKKRRTKLVRKLIYHPARQVPEMDKKAWLLKATHFQFIPSTFVIPEYLVFVHTFLEGLDNTWIAVFSRDACVIAFVGIIYVSILYGSFTLYCL
jgi:hypothetical protein